MKAKITLLSNSESDIITLGDALAQGYVQREDYPAGFLTRGESDYAEVITRFKVTSSALDGPRKSRTFANVEGVVRYLKAEGWTNEGGVSDDGVTRLDSVFYNLKSCGGFLPYPHPILRAFLLKLARESA